MAWKSLLAESTGARAWSDATHGWLMGCSLVSTTKQFVY
jgi:hypothetical protein